MASSQPPFSAEIAPRARHVQITARPRIHIGLIDLGNASKRCFGGVGFNVDCYCTTWEMTAATEVALDKISVLDELAKRQLNEIGSTLYRHTDGRGFTAKLINAPPLHVGFGTKTTLALSLIKAADTLFDLKLNESAIVRMSGRGGASGIGVHLFFTGGIVWDGGHKSPATHGLMPSGAVASPEIPPLIARWAFPTDWRVALLLPPGNIVAGENEISFFSRHAPTTKAAALETMSAMYHHVIPAFVMKDLDLLRDGLRYLHQVGFKRCELEMQSQATQSIVIHLQKRFPSGMSSDLLP